MTDGRTTANERFDKLKNKKKSFIQQTEEREAMPRLPRTLMY